MLNNNNKKGAFMILFWLSLAFYASCARMNKPITDTKTSPVDSGLSAYERSQRTQHRLLAPALPPNENRASVHEERPTLTCSHGHVNPYVRPLRCVCEYGWSGQRCDVDAIPACRRAGDGREHHEGIREVDACTSRKPLPCGCLRQCLAAGAFALHLREPWPTPVCLGPLRAKLFGWSVASSAQGGSTFERAPQPIAMTRGELHFSPRKHLQHDIDFERSLCPLNCSHPRGGRCVRGACVCSPGRFGAGCVFDSMPVGSSTLSAEARLRVYVYELPAMLTLRRSWASDWDEQGLFSTAQHFVAALVADAATVTADPASADIYVVPNSGTNMEGLPDYYAQLVRHLGDTSPYFRRHGGRDHVWFCSADHGGSLAGRAYPASSKAL
jgi:hypothetical protein